jgi:hypothetical protein
VDCRPVGTARAALKYLAPYIFRVALSNNRIVRVADDQVTFRYTVGDTGQTAYCTLPVQEFLRRFLQHILPKGFVKVRYYGLFRVGMRRSLARLRNQLQLLLRSADQVPPAPAVSDSSTREVICPSCGQPMRLERVLLPHTRGPPGWVNQQQWRMLGLCRRRLTWLSIHMPAWVCPGAVLTARYTCNSGRAWRNLVLIRTREHLASTHELRECGPVRWHTSATSV